LLSGSSRMSVMESGLLFTCSYLSSLKNLARIVTI